MFFTGGEKVYGRNEASASMPGLFNISKYVEAFEATYHPY
jgi:hypothetical protein